MSDLLQEIKIARQKYRNTELALKFCNDEIAVAENRLAREKLGFLIRKAKEEGLKANCIDFVASERRH